MKLGRQKTPLPTNVVPPTACRAATEEQSDSPNHHIPILVVLQERVSGAAGKDTPGNIAQRKVLCVEPARKEVITRGYAKAPTA